MDKLTGLISRIGPLDVRAMAQVQKRLDSLTKPQGSLGRLEELAKHVAGITGNVAPQLKNKIIFVFAGDHGVTCEGVSAFPREVTRQMVCNFLQGGAGINVLARHADARVVVADLGVAGDLEKNSGLIVKKIAYGTKNIAQGPAMTRDEAIAAIEAGADIFADEYKKGIDIAGTGEMGIGNTTPASAIVSALTGAAVEEVTGRGTGIVDAALANKIAVIKKALDVNKPDAKDGIDVLAKVGGYEIAGLCGVILAAAAHKVPVLIDGFISTAAALIAYTLCPVSREYMISAHASVEPGHKIMLKYLDLRPIVDLDMRLGEGTGAAIGITIVEAGVRILNEMATFGEAGVSNKQDE